MVIDMVGVAPGEVCAVGRGDGRVALGLEGGREGGREGGGE